MLINFKKKKNRVLLENKNICTLNFANNGRTFFNTVQKYCCFTHIYFNFFFYYYCKYTYNSAKLLYNLLHTKDFSIGMKSTRHKITLYIAPYVYLNYQLRFNFTMHFFVDVQIVYFI